MEPEHSLNIFSLPREIRDCIYSHDFRGRVFSQRNTTAPPLFTIPDLPMDGKNAPNFEIFEDPNGLEILLASKAVNREATEIFYAECEFKFTYSESPDKDTLPLPDLAIMGQLRKVEFTIKHVHRISSPLLETNVERDHHFASVITSIACQERQRQTLTLVLDCYVGHSRCLHYAIWLQALKDLKTHSTAVIKIKILADWNSSGWPFPLFGRWEEREVLMNDIKRALEPTMGRCSIFEENDALGIEFWPSRKDERRVESPSGTVPVVAPDSVAALFNPRVPGRW